MIGLPFWAQVSSSETATCNIPILIVWAKRNQWLWALLSLSMLWGSRKRLKQYHSSQDVFAHWAIKTALIGKMAEIGGRIVGEYGSDACVSL